MIFHKKYVYLHPYNIMYSLAVMKLSHTLFTVLALAATANASAAVQETALVVNEICSSNIDQWVDPSFNYGGWIELYNPTGTAIGVTGWYLSDDPDNLKKAKVTQNTTVKAGGYQTLWFDHYHSWHSPKTLDMKLNTEGGTLYLSNGIGQIQLTIEYPAAVARCSWARTTDGGAEWSYCATPTPGRSNAGQKFASERLAAPEVNMEAKVFSSGSQSVRVTIPEGCTLRYTTDGSTPTLTNGSTSTTGSFTVSATRLYRFRLFKDGYLPSPVVTRSFIKSTNDIDLPILSIVGTQKNFYGDSLGIFVQGVNGRPGNGKNYKCNWNMDWERPATFEYFTGDGQLLFSQEVGIERCGGWSRAWEPWSFKIKSGKMYEGFNSLNYPFFAEKPNIKLKSLQIRNGGNDSWCRIKDAALQTIVARSGIDADHQAYQPVAHFVNGEWKGTINMRETNNKHYVYSNYGLDDEDIDQFEMSPDSGYVQKCGDKVAMTQLLNLSKVCSNDQTFLQIAELLDVDEYCNYMAIQLYLGNWDWPQNNVKGWHPRFENGKFRFVLYDLDGSFSASSPFTDFANKQTYTFDQRYGQPNNSRLTKEIEVVTLFLNLLNNATFRKKFIDSYCLVQGSVFEPTRSAAIVNELATTVEHTQGQYNWGSPWSTANDVINSLKNRQANMITLLKNYSKMQLNGKTAQRANIKANISEARITYNDIPMPFNEFSGQLFAPVILQASAPAGYRFVGWKKSSSSSSTLMAANATWKYYDKGSLDNTQWKSESFSDASWSSGAAPLGYANDGRTLGTRINYGGNSNNKYPTYYFRKTISLSKEPMSSDIFTLDFTIDDGCVIYVNGVEASRYNMPGGTISYSTWASTYANNNPDTGSITLDPSLFHKGNNVIAVEVHNNSATSTDIEWGASLSYASSESGELVCETPYYTLPATGTINVMACFEPVSDASALHPVVINEVSASNSIYVNDLWKKSDWVELYNTTDEDIDLAGMFLTDKITKPEKWQIPDPSAIGSTDVNLSVIPAHGFKIIWCDKLESTDALHTTFKLGNEDGGQVMLTAADGSWSDTLTYCLHEGTESVGRFPDASRKVYKMTRTTFASSNTMTWYNRAYNQPDPNAIEEVLPDLETIDGYAIYDLSGRLITEGEGTIEAELPRGIYVVRANGQSRKIMIP